MFSQNDSFWHVKMHIRFFSTVSIIWWIRQTTRTGRMWIKTSLCCIAVAFVINELIFESTVLMRNENVECVLFVPHLSYRLYWYDCHAMTKNNSSLSSALRKSYECRLNIQVIVSSSQRHLSKCVKEWKTSNQRKWKRNNHVLLCVCISMLSESSNDELFEKFSAFKWLRIGNGMPSIHFALRH